MSESTGGDADFSGFGFARVSGSAFVRTNPRMTDPSDDFVTAFNTEVKRIPRVENS